MYFLRCLGLFFLLMCYSCKKNAEGDSSVAFSFENSKPVVTLVPMFDSTHHEWKWDISQELTYAVHHRLTQKDCLRLIDHGSWQESTKKLHRIKELFTLDARSIKKTFPNEEFVILMQLANHEEVPFALQKDFQLTDVAANLNIGVRLKIWDLSHREPKIILHELLHYQGAIPKQFTRYNFTQIPWQEEGFYTTPLGIAHIEFSQDLSKRIQDTILLAKKNLR